MPDLAAEGFPLVGGRIDVIAGTPVPALVYGRRLQTISVWAATAPLAVRLTGDATDINGTNLVVWRSGDMTYWAASDLGSAELAAFAKLFAASS